MSSTPVADVAFAVVYSGIILQCPATGRVPIVTFHHKQNPLTEITFVNLQVRSLMNDLKDPVRLAGSLEDEATRVLRNAREYLMEIQIPERQLKEEFRMSDRDIQRYQNLWADSLEELNLLEHYFKIRGQENNHTRSK